MKLSKHFNDNELLSPELLVAIRTNNALASWYINENQILTLEHIRAYFGKPVFVNIDEHPHRGICTDKECIDQGRHITSQHARGGAFDITVTDITQTEVGGLIREIAPIYKIGGMGINEVKGFIHIDWRNSKELVEWTY